MQLKRLNIVPTARYTDQMAGLWVHLQTYEIQHPLHQRSEYIPDYSQTVIVKFPESLKN